MKITNYFLIAIFCCSSIYAQKLTVADLSTLCSKKNWEDVNQSMLAKNWTYFDSEKGSTENYSTITWSYEKSTYSDEAEGWFYLYTYEGSPNKLRYVCLNKESFTVMQNSIASTNFKLIGSEIEDNQVISTYSNALYSLEISTEKREDEDDLSRSFTLYAITIIKRSGVYDPDNGKKIISYDDGTYSEYTLVNGKINGLRKDFYENGNIESEYFKLNGELNGSFKSYYSSGKLSLTGNYLNGKKHGIFVEYDEDGVKNKEIEMANGMLNGVSKYFTGGKISFLYTFKNDVKNGPAILYEYDQDSERLLRKKSFQFLNDTMNGAQKTIIIQTNKKEKVVEYSYYTMGQKNGEWQFYEGDSLILCSFKNDQLHGEFRIYTDVNWMKSMEDIADISNLPLTTVGSYNEGLQSGYWKEYDLSGTLIREGGFSKGLVAGEWKYYYSSWSDGSLRSMPYSKQLYLVQNFSNGKLEGKSTQYSSLNEEKYICDKIDENYDISDTCTRLVCYNILAMTFYKNGMLNGTYEFRDSVNDLIVSGFFKDDLRDGEWIAREEGVTRQKRNSNLSDEFVFTYSKGNYAKGKKEGKWIIYIDNDEIFAEDKILETCNYQDGILHGQYVVWNQNNKFRTVGQYKYGKLTEVIAYDSTGVRPEIKYEVSDFRGDYKCRITEYQEKGIESQEYWLIRNGELDNYYFDPLLAQSIFDGETSYKDGEFKETNYEYQPIIEGKYFREARVGVWTFYYYDQNVKIEFNYNFQPAIEKYFNLRGQLLSGQFVSNDDGYIEKRRIRNGLRDGLTIYVNSKTNKVFKKENYKNGNLK